MHTHGELRIEPGEDTLAATREWLRPVRKALGPDFLSAYLTGSVLTQGFHPKRSRVNLLVVARELPPERLDALIDATPKSRRSPRFEPLFLTRHQIENSLDSFPIEWLEIKERHLRIEGEDIFGPLEVPRTHLRLQCEHELRAKNIRLRQSYLANRKHPAELEEQLRSAASGVATLFRTLLRLRGENPPSDNAHVIERVADVFHVDASGLLAAHLIRHSEVTRKRAEVVALYRKFMVEFDRLVSAIDGLPVK
ncbi:MAG: hypothetical protein A2W00_08090 [Candidatus Eisenbacteria bacterium RBG_16_71_46]|nr:MAG: hypothetical protein A2W00_08090 [Candidatus Eisenbacteria bacterium RBG_16_71_46]